MRSKDEIERFQKNIGLIRKILGMSEKELADSIGVTRQTINKIANEKYPLTRTQYLAMRMIIEDEKKDNPKENEMLANVIDVLVDNPDDYTEKQKEKILEMANLLAPAIITKSNTKKEVSKQFMGILGSLGIAVGTLTLIILTGKNPKGGKK